MLYVCTYYFVIGIKLQLESDTSWLFEAIIYIYLASSVHQAQADIISCDKSIT